MAADSATLSYLTTLSLVLSPLPSLSSSISNSLASLTSLPPTTSSTKCSHCGTELVGGINGSFRLEKGAVWTTCEGCGWRMRREEVGEGRRVFARVKRRKVEVDGESWSTKKVLGLEQDVGTTTTTAAAPPAPPTATTSLPPTLPTKTTAQAFPKPALPLATQLSPPPPTSRAKPTPPPSLPSPRPSASPSPATTPPPSSDPSKKRKRTKQPSGLAQLLEAKRREKEAGGERAVGLQDFLAGM